MDSCQKMPNIKSFILLLAEEIVDPRIEFQVILDAMAFMWRNCNDTDLHWNELKVIKLAQIMFCQVYIMRHLSLVR